MLYVIMGASGAGKTSLVNKVIEGKEFKKILSNTTRPMRKNEINGKDYHFLSLEEFGSKEMLESSCYAGNWYGTSKKEVEQFIKNKTKGIHIMEVEGAKTLKKLYKANICLVSLKCSFAILEERLKKKNCSEEERTKRLALIYKNQIECMEASDVILENNHSLDELVEQFILWTKLWE